MSRARLSLAGLLGGCAWALASAGQAQQTPGLAQQPPSFGSTTGYGAGPGFGAPFGAPGGAPLSVTLSTTGTYNTNVAGGSEVIARERHLPSLGDASVTPSAEVDANKTLGPEQVFLHTQYSYSLFDRDTKLDHQYLDVEAGGQGQLASCQAQVTGLYSRYQSELAELSVKSANNTSELKQVALNASCPRPIGITPQLSITQSWLNNDTRALETTDHNTFTVQGGLAYARPVFGNLSVNGQYVETTFPFRLLPTQGEDGYRLYGGGLHYDRPIGARLTTSATVNYVKLDLEGAGGASAGNGFSGPTYVVDATYTASARLSAHVMAERDTKPSAAVNAAYTLVQDESEELNYQLNARLMLTAGAKQMDNSYRGSLLNGAPQGLGLLTGDDRHDYYANALLTLNSRLSVSLTVRDEIRHADPAQYSYHSLQTSLRLSATF